jgi:hypothetical protein
MQPTIDRLPGAVPSHAGSSLAELGRRLAVAGLLLTALTLLASIALTAQS